MSRENQSINQEGKTAGAIDVLTKSRRWLLLKAGVLVNGVVGAAISVPILRYVWSPVKSPGAYSSWVSLGSVDDFPVGETRLAKFTNPSKQSWDGETDRVACWVRRTGRTEFQVFAINCAHLGCPVRWFPQSQLFMCPCHGGAYYADGARASGTTERGLFTYDSKVVTGILQIRAGQLPTLSRAARLTRITNTKDGSPCVG